MKKTLKTLQLKNDTINLLTLPGSNFFRFEIVNQKGSDIEREYKNKKIYGLSHFIEHLSFKSPRDYTTEQLNYLINNKGEHNASTDYNRIDYWFQTNTDNAELALSLVCNYAFNDLKKISKNEFETEKNVVINEINRYLDDPQEIFANDLYKTMFSLKKEDNVLGTMEIIKELTLEDAIELKKKFLTFTNLYNIVYDPLIISEKKVLKLLKTELKKWNINSYCKDYYPNLIEKNGYIKIKNKAKQSLTGIVLNLENNLKINVLDEVVHYIREYADETSLNNYIREKNGLTYGIFFDNWTVMKKHYITFLADVEKGNEELLYQLFEKSILNTVNSFNKEKFDKFIESRLLKSTIERLSQEVYTEIFDIVRLFPYYVEENKEILEKDLDKFFDNSIKNIKYDDFEQILNKILFYVKSKHNLTIISNY